MQKIQHTLSGAVVAFAFIFVASPQFPDSVILFVMVLAGSMFPDIDTEFMHRALLHNVGVLLFLALFVPLYHPLIFFVAGIILHLILDVFSEGNIRLLFPADAILKGRLTDFLNLDFIRGVPNDSTLAWVVTGLVTAFVCGGILVWYGVV